MAKNPIKQLGYRPSEAMNNFMESILKGNALLSKALLLEVSLKVLSSFNESELVTVIGKVISGQSIESHFASFSQPQNIRKGGFAA